MATVAFRSTASTVVRGVRAREPAYDAPAMEAFVQGWGLTIVLCALIVLVFFAGWLHVHRELGWCAR